MPRIQTTMKLLSAGPFHTITEVEVQISPDLNDGDVYKPEYWKEEYALSKQGLSKLATAAGLVVLPEHEKSEMLGDRVFKATTVLRYLQPDGKAVDYPGTKNFDFRVEGTRWVIAHQKEMDRQLKDWAKENGVKKTFMTKKGRGGKEYKDWEDDSHFIVRIRQEMEREGHSELLHMFDLFAREKATRFVNQQAQFGIELAQTGALDRSVRQHLAIKSTYTPQELSEGFFLVRSEFRFEEMLKRLGGEKAEALLTAYAAKQLGVEEQTLKMLAAPRQEEGEVIDAGDFLDIAPEVPEEESGLFSQPIDMDVLKEVRELVKVTHGIDPLSIREFDEKLVKVLGKPHTEMTQGELLLVKTFYEKIYSSKVAGASKNELGKQIQHILPYIQRCAQEKRLWKEPEEDQEQLTLPIEEEPSDE